MTENSTVRRTALGAQTEFFLTGFKQAAGIRTYAFYCKVDARRMDYTVEVDLALLPGYGISIQDLPLLCRELLQQRGQPDEISAVVFTRQRMSSHAEELATARLQAQQKRKSYKHGPNANAGPASRPTLR